jgi:hypothetical protein
MSFKVKVYGRTDGRTTDGRRTKSDHKSSPCHFVTGELKTNNKKKNKTRQNYNIVGTILRGLYVPYEMCKLFPFFTSQYLSFKNIFSLISSISRFFQQLKMSYTQSHLWPKLAFSINEFNSNNIIIKLGKIISVYSFPLILYITGRDLYNSKCPCTHPLNRTTVSYY